MVSVGGVVAIQPLHVPVKSEHWQRRPLRPDDRIKHRSQRDRVGCREICEPESETASSQSSWDRLMATYDATYAL